MIIDTLKLPPSYPHDLAHRLHVPVRLSRVPNGERDNIGNSSRPHLVLDRQS